MRLEKWANGQPFDNRKSCLIDKANKNANKSWGVNINTRLHFEWPCMKLLMINELMIMHAFFAYFFDLSKQIRSKTK